MPFPSRVLSSPVFAMIHGALAYPLLAFLTLVAACDVRTRRIPNVLSFSAIVAGLVINGALAGASGLLASAAGLLTAMLILFPPFALGGIGGGDVKMMGAVGAFVGPRMVLAAMACGMILGGVVMVGVLARRGILSDKLMGTFVMLRSAVVTRSIAPLRAPAAAPGAIALPYSVPLALGTVAALGYSRAFGG